MNKEVDMDRRQASHAILVAMASPSMLNPGTASAQAKTWSPQKPVRIIPNAAGGILEVVARQIGERLGPALGQPVIVENKPGAGSIVAMEAVKTSPADGHTLGITSFFELTINPWLYDRLPYDPLKDFEPVVTVYSGQMLLVAHPSFPGTSLTDLIRIAKADPGKWFYASSGLARPPHIWIERFKATAGLDIRHVPFKGADPLTQAVLSGEVPLAMEGVPPLLPHVKAGKLKPLAVTGDRRLLALPDVPTFAEAGVPGIGLTWVGLVAAAGTPGAAVERLNAEVVRILRAPDFAAAYEQAGRVVVADTPEQFAQTIRKELPEWGAIVKATGLRPE
jgi:tripartite-type tricarboxylate transporter receptor subunit TctC